jgi:hypothetical protein
MERQMTIGNRTMTPSEIWDGWVGQFSPLDFVRLQPAAIAERGLSEVVWDYVDSLDEMNIDEAMDDLDLGEEDRDTFREMLHDGLTAHIEASGVLNATH